MDEFSQQDPQFHDRNITLHQPHGFFHFHIHKSYLVTFLLFLLGLGMGAGVVKATQNANAPKQTLTITGTGTIYAKADKAMIQATITGTSTDSKTTQSVKDIAHKYGISDNNITVGTYKSYVYPSPAISETPQGAAPYARVFTPPAVIGTPGNYTAETETTVTITFLNKQVNVAKQVNNEINDLSGVSLENGIEYYVSDISSYQDQARQKALQDAQQQVNDMVKTNNIHVGKVRSIKDTSQKDSYAVQTKDVYADPEEKTAPVTASYEVVYEID